MSLLTGQANSPCFMRTRELCSSPSGLPRALVVMEEGEVETAQSPLAPPVPEEGDNFFSKAWFGAAQLVRWQIFGYYALDSNLES